MGGNSSRGRESPRKPPENLHSSWLVPGICLGLAVITLTVFGRTLGHDFVNFDDDKYVYESAVVMKGLSFASVQWAFTHFHCHNWHPLTTLSQMLDCELYDLRPGGHHFTNVFLHTCSVVLLFLVLRAMTGTLWRSAFVAALFAIHPLRVESVAWVAERKDVLSGVFFILGLAAYVRYARRPALSRYLLVTFCFLLGLMSKPMLVTFPLVCLLLDYWPLRRFSPGSPHGSFGLAGKPARSLIVEKLPLLGLSIASSVVTLFAQRTVLEPIEEFSLPVRIGNAFVSYVEYAWQTIWPLNLAVLYPHPASLNILEVAGAILLIVAAVTVAIVFRRGRPYMLTGLLWYLVMLLPVIGIVQVGGQARADRYTYLPQIGLFVLATWTISDLVSRRQHARKGLAAATAALIACFAWRAWVQTGFWRDAETLWRHTIAVTEDNDVALNGLGAICLKQGKVDEASACFEASLRIWPNNPLVHDNLAKAYLRKGELDEALKHYTAMLQLDPASAMAHVGLGKVLIRKGRLDEALEHDETAVKLDPDLADAHGELGNALLQKGEIEEARSQYRKMIDLLPFKPGGYFNLGVTFHREGRLQEAITWYEKALAISPDFSVAREARQQALRQSGRSE